jgi:hypothetical protein
LKILVGDKDSVDFDAPIAMTERQLQEFLEFMKSVFAVVGEEYTPSHRVDRIGDKFFTTRRWSAGEYTLIFRIDSDDNIALAEKLGRTPMSIHIRRGQTLPIFLSWLKEKNVDLLSADVAVLVKEFMKERKEQIINRREKRSELRRLKGDYESMDSGERSKVLQIYRSLGDNAKVRQFNRLKEKLRGRIEALERELAT